MATFGDISFERTKHFADFFVLYYYEIDFESIFV